MTTKSLLTIDLLKQIDDRQLQTNYLTLDDRQSRSCFSYRYSSLELAANPELVEVLVSELRDICFYEKYLRSNIFKIFQKDRIFAKQFIDIAEKTLIQVINNRELQDLYNDVYTHAYNDVLILGSIGNRAESITVLKQIIIPLAKVKKQLITIEKMSILYPIAHCPLPDFCKKSILEEEHIYNKLDSAIFALEKIGNELAISALLDCLPYGTYYGWIENQLYNLAYKGAISLSKISRLWSIEHQVHKWRAIEIIPIVQEQWGRYNPDFVTDDFDINETLPVQKNRLREIIESM